MQRDSCVLEMKEALTGPPHSAVRVVRGVGSVRSAATPGKLPVRGRTSAAPDLTPKWKVGKGFFEVKDGVVTVSENPDDKHGAYAYVRPVFTFKDIVVEYSAKLDGSRSCNLMVNDTAYKESHAGHILRATILPGKVDLADQKIREHGQRVLRQDEGSEGPPTTRRRSCGRASRTSRPRSRPRPTLSQWHKIRVEIVGDEMLLCVDDQPAGYLKSKGLDHATKNSIGFEVGGKSSLIKGMKIWEAAPSKDWASGGMPWSPPSASSGVVAEFSYSTPPLIV
jgi:hypothetical protein